MENFLHDQNKKIQSFFPVISLNTNKPLKKSKNACCKSVSNLVFCRLPVQ